VRRAVLRQPDVDLVRARVPVEQHVVFVVAVHVRGVDPELAPDLLHGMELVDRREVEACPELVDGTEPDPDARAVRRDGIVV
jgi:hypothetical protein